MKATERNGHARCTDDMERKVVSHRRQYCCRTFASVLSLMFSVVSLAYCVFLSVQTSEIKERVAELENGNAELLYRPVPGFALDKLNSMIHDRVDQLLSQRSYEHLAKMRVARQAPADCSCPPVTGSSGHFTHFPIERQQPPTTGGSCSLEDPSDCRC